VPAAPRSPAPVPGAEDTVGFGRLPDGRAVARHVLRAEGVELHLLAYGARVHRLRVADPAGRLVDVALGHPDLAGYLASDAFLGATIGRYANRIAAGRFVLDGRPVQLPVTDRGNHLHGGPDGFDTRLWEVVAVSERHCTFRHVSPAGHQGYPGEVTATVRYQVDADEVRVDHHATTDAPTVLTMTNHTYFHLDGEGADHNVDRHLLQVEAESYLPLDPTSVPTGERAPVAGTPLDFREPRRLGTAVRQAHPLLAAPGGVDHHLVLAGTGLRPVARLGSPDSGITVELASDQPGLQVYTGNAFDGSMIGTGGRRYRQGDGVALEPQAFPDAPNHADFPSTRLDPGEEYTSTLVWRFSARAPHR
jgi:galactose mutarotase-like enzyme